MIQKVGLRETSKARRAELARTCPDFAQRIVRFVDALDLEPGAVVSFYWPMGDEADPRMFANALGARGHTLTLPVVVAKKSPLHFREWRAGDALVVHSFGMHEPSEHARTVTPDVLLVPLLAFDARGTRLGYGGGFYDRTLHALAKKRAIGVAFAGQQVDVLPSHAHDHPLEAVITEKGVRHFI